MAELFFKENIENIDDIIENNKKFLSILKSNVDYYNDLIVNNPDQLDAKEIVSKMKVYYPEVVKSYHTRREEMIRVYGKDLEPAGIEEEMNKLFKEDMDGRKEYNALNLQLEQNQIEGNLGGKFYDKEKKLLMLSLEVYKTLETLADMLLNGIKMFQLIENDI